LPAYLPRYALFLGLFSLPTCLLSGFSLKRCRFAAILSTYPHGPKCSSPTPRKKNVTQPDHGAHPTSVVWRGAHNVRNGGCLCLTAPGHVGKDTSCSCFNAMAGVLVRAGLDHQDIIARNSAEPLSPCARGIAWPWPWSGGRHAQPALTQRPGTKCI
jgi:hypothetical protein